MPAQVILRDTIKLFCHTAPVARGAAPRIIEKLLLSSYCFGVRCLLPLHQTMTKLSVWRHPVSLSDGTNPLVRPDYLPASDGASAVVPA